MENSWRKAILRLWLCACVGAGAHAAAAGAPVQIDVLEDAGGALRLDQVRAPARTAQFRPAAGTTLNFGLSSSAYWLRLTLAPGRAETLLVEIATPYLDVVDFHDPDATPARLIETGDQRPFHSRPIDYRHPVFALERPTSEPRSYYLRVRNAGAVQIPLRFIDPASFSHGVAQEQAWFGAFYGLFGAMVLYNLFLFVGVRDRAYLWYVVYVSLFGLFLFARNGFAFQWLWPGSPWLGNHAHYLLIAGAVAAAAQFTRHFLSTAAQAPRIDRLLRLAAAFGVVVVGAVVLGEQRLAVLLVQVHALAAVACGLAAAVLVRRAGFRPATYYLLAFATPMAASLLSVARNLGFFPANWIANYGVQIGSGVEIVLLALGLADRINTLKREKAAAQAAAVETLRRSEHELELRVQARTEELARANALLREREGELERMADHDFLTGLANRRLLTERLALALARSQRSGSPVAVLLLDLDNFKPVNDLHGHEGGDALLRATAERLRACVRATDTVARFGGDEFVVLLDPLAAVEDCDAVAGKILVSLARPVDFRGASLRVTPSVGIALYPEDAEDAQDLLRRADDAMYEAKRAGRACARRSSTGKVTVLP